MPRHLERQACFANAARSRERQESSGLQLMSQGSDVLFVPDETTEFGWEIVQRLRLCILVCSGTRRPPPRTITLARTER